MNRLLRLVSVIIIITAGTLVRLFACTSFIVSAEVSATGKPFMFKNRDTGHLDNRVAYFHGPVYAFIGIENTDSVLDEIWSGTNSAGFSIINTAAYNFKEDSLPENLMDREGVVMKTALGRCGTVDEFESLLGSMPKPLGVETNFGVIDAHGGAAYFECNNSRWVRHDVADEPGGYMVVTNFCRSGNPELVRGYERYLTASAIMRELIGDDSKLKIDHLTAVNQFSRSYRNELLELDFVSSYDEYASSGAFNGIAVDQDFIPRHSTASVVAIEGVSPGENPLHTVMWTLLGYPACGVYIPLTVADRDIVPAYMKAGESCSHSAFCDMAMEIKEKYVFPYRVGSGERYLNLRSVLKGDDKLPSLVGQCRKIELFVDSVFSSIFEKWKSGLMTDEEFFSRSSVQSSLYYEKYRSEMAVFWE